MNNQDCTLDISMNTTIAISNFHCMRRERCALCKDESEMTILTEAAKIPKDDVLDFDKSKQYRFPTSLVSNLEYVLHAAE